MAKVKDITGHRFGRLTALSFVRDEHNAIKWNCICDCGNSVCIYGGNLRNGYTKSCGCILRGNRTSHGMSYSAEHQTWSGMKSRCYNINNPKYPRYGGRGITVSDRWKDSFENFYEDMGDKPTPKHTLDRIENDDGYYKENCRWATALVQANNTRKNVFIEYKGEILTVSQWARKLNMSAALIGDRIRHKTPLELVFSTDNLQTTKKHKQIKQYI